MIVIPHANSRPYFYPAIVRCAFLLIGLLTPAQAQRAEHLSKISPTFLTEMQRIAAALSLAEFPIKPKDAATYLGLPPYRDTGGMGGKNIRPRMWWQLSDKDDANGYYRLDVYYAHDSTSPRDVVITGIDLVFVSSSQGIFPTAEFVYQSRGEPDALARERAKMHELKMTPGEFVRYRGEQARAINQESFAPTDSLTKPPAP